MREIRMRRVREWWKRKDYLERAIFWMDIAVVCMTINTICTIVAVVGKWFAEKG